MIDPATAYEEASNAVDAIHNDGFYALVTQEYKTRWPVLGEAMRAAGLVEHADAFEDFVRSDGDALAAQSTLPAGSPDFVPSQDWDAVFAEILERNGASYVEDKLEDFRTRHGLDAL